MAENIFTSGHIVTVAAPAAVTSGQFVVVGVIRGVALTSAGSGANVALQLCGEALLPKASGDGTAIAAGAAVYWDATNSVVTGTAGSNARIGAAVRAAANGDVVVRVVYQPY